MTQWKNWRSGTKYKAVGSRDETGAWIPSKLEAKVIARYRALAWEEGWGVALHPCFAIEGGRYSADILLIQIPRKEKTREELESDEWYPCWMKILDAKGFDTSASRKSRRQIKERYGFTVKIIKA